MKNNTSTVFYITIIIATLLMFCADIKQQDYYDSLIMESKILLSGKQSSNLIRHTDTGARPNKNCTPNAICFADMNAAESLQMSLSLVESVPLEEISLGYGNCTYADMQNVQVNKSYNIPADFYYDVLPTSMHPIIDSICELESTSEISSMYLIAVAATEVGWGTAFSEENNWFNWTPDTEYYQYFTSAQECVEYTGIMYSKKFFNPEWYALYNQDMDDHFTVPEINTRYALMSDCSVNWNWTSVVTEIMYSLNCKYQDWIAQETEV